MYYINNIKTTFYDHTCELISRSYNYTELVTNVTKHNIVSIASCIYNILLSNERNVLWK